MSYHRCLKAIGFFPCLVLWLILFYGYYSYIISFCGEYLAQRYLPVAVLFGILFHILYLLLWYSYLRVVFTHPGTPPPEFKVARETLQQWQQEGGDLDARVSQLVGRDVKLLLKKHDGALRYCDSCELVKPDRTHHCGSCGECVTKFDHHCPWINNCVGWRNYKFFILFLFYGTLFCLYVLLSAGPFVIHAYQTPGEGNFLWLIMLLFAGAFSLALILFLGMHMRLLLSNLTTIEDMDKKRTQVYQELGYWPFDLGKGANVRQVMGEKVWFWFVPIANLPHDGVVFPVRAQNDIEEGESLLGSEAQ